MTGGFSRRGSISLHPSHLESRGSGGPVSPRPAASRRRTSSRGGGSNNAHAPSDDPPPPRVTTRRRAVDATVSAGGAGGAMSQFYAGPDHGASAAGSPSSPPRASRRSSRSPAGRRNSNDSQASEAPSAAPSTRSRSGARRRKGASPGSVMSTRSTSHRNQDMSLMMKAELELMNGRVKEIQDKYDAAVAENDSYKELIEQLNAQVDELSAGDQPLIEAIQDLEKKLADSEAEKAALQKQISSQQKIAREDLELLKSTVDDLLVKNRDTVEIHAEQLSSLRMAHVKEVRKLRRENKVLLTALEEKKHTDAHDMRRELEVHGEEERDMYMPAGSLESERYHHLRKQNSGGGISSNSEGGGVGIGSKKNKGSAPSDRPPSMESILYSMGSSVMPRGSLTDLDTDGDLDRIQGSEAVNEEEDADPVGEGIPAGKHLVVSAETAARDAEAPEILNRMDSGGDGNNNNNTNENGGVRFTFGAEDPDDTVVAAVTTRLRYAVLFPAKAVSHSTFMPVNDLLNQLTVWCRTSARARLRVYERGGFRVASQMVHNECLRGHHASSDILVLRNALRLVLLLVDVHMAKRGLAFDLRRDEAVERQRALEEEAWRNGLPPPPRDELVPAAGADFERPSVRTMFVALITRIDDFPSQALALHVLERVLRHDGVPEMLATSEFTASLFDLILSARRTSSAVVTGNPSQANAAAAAVAGVNSNGLSSSSTSASSSSSASRGGGGGGSSSSAAATSAGLGGGGYSDVGSGLGSMFGAAQVMALATHALAMICGTGTACEIVYQLGRVPELIGALMHLMQPPRPGEIVPAEVRRLRKCARRSIMRTLWELSADCDLRDIMYSIDRFFAVVFRSVLELGEVKTQEEVELARFAAGVMLHCSVDPDRQDILAGGEGLEALLRSMELADLECCTYASSAIYNLTLNVRIHVLLHSNGSISRLLHIVDHPPSVSVRRHAVRALSLFVASPETARDVQLILGAADFGGNPLGSPRSAERGGKVDGSHGASGSGGTLAHQNSAGDLSDRRLLRALLPVIAMDASHGHRSDGNAAAARGRRHGMRRDPEEIARERAKEERRKEKEKEKEFEERLHRHLEKKSALVDTRSMASAKRNKTAPVGAPAIADAPVIPARKLERMHSNLRFMAELLQSKGATEKDRSALSSLVPGIDRKRDGGDDDGDGNGDDDGHCDATRGGGVSSGADGSGAGTGDGNAAGDGDGGTGGGGGDASGGADSGNADGTGASGGEDHPAAATSQGTSGGGKLRKRRNSLYENLAMMEAMREAKKQEASNADKEEKRREVEMERKRKEEEARERRKREEEEAKERRKREIEEAAAQPVFDAVIGSQEFYNALKDLGIITEETVAEGVDRARAFFKDLHELGALEATTSALYSEHMLIRRAAARFLALMLRGGCGIDEATQAFADDTLAVILRAVHGLVDGIKSEDGRLRASSFECMRHICSVSTAARQELVNDAGALVLTPMLRKMVADMANDPVAVSAVDDPRRTEAISCLHIIHFIAQRPSGRDDLVEEGTLSVLRDCLLQKTQFPVEIVASIFRAVCADQTEDAINTVVSLNVLPLLLHLLAADDIIGKLSVAGVIGSLFSTGGYARQHVLESLTDESLHAIVSQLSCGSRELVRTLLRILSSLLPDPVFRGRVFERGIVIHLLGCLKDPRIAPCAEAVTCLHVLAEDPEFFDRLMKLHGPALLVRSLHSDDEDTVVAATHFLRLLFSRKEKAAAMTSHATIARLIQLAVGGRVGTSGLLLAHPEDLFSPSSSSLSLPRLPSPSSAAVAPTGFSHAQFGALALLESLAHHDMQCSAMMEHGVIACAVECLGSSSLPIRRQTLMTLGVLIPSRHFHLRAHASDLVARLMECFAVPDITVLIEALRTATLLLDRSVGPEAAARRRRQRYADGDGADSNHNNHNNHAGHGFGDSMEEGGGERAGSSRVSASTSGDRKFAHLPSVGAPVAALLRSHGIVSIAFSTLRHQSAEVAYESARLLASASHDADLSRDVLATEGGAKLIAYNAGSPNEEERIAALECARGMAAVDECAEALVEEGIVEALVASLRDRTLSVCDPAVVRSGRPRSRGLGAGDASGAGVGDGIDPNAPVEVRERYAPPSLHALSLLMRLDRARRRLLMVDGLGTVLDYMSEIAVEQGIAFLLHVARARDPALLQKLGVLGATSMLLRFVTHGTASHRRSILETCVLLLSVPENKPRFVGEGGLDVCLSLATDPDSGTRRYAILCIVWLVKAPTSPSVFERLANIVGLVTATIEVREIDEATHAHCFDIMFYLSRYRPEALLKAIVDVGGFPKLVHYFRFGSADTTFDDDVDEGGDDGANIDNAEHGTGSGADDDDFSDGDDYVTSDDERMASSRDGGPGQLARRRRRRRKRDDPEYRAERERKRKSKAIATLVAREGLVADRPDKSSQGPASGGGGGGGGDGGNTENPPNSVPIKRVIVADTTRAKLACLRLIGELNRHASCRATVLISPVMKPIMECFVMNDLGLLHEVTAFMSDLAKYQDARSILKWLGVLREITGVLSRMAEFAVYRGDTLAAAFRCVQYMCEDDDNRDAFRRFSGPQILLRWINALVSEPLGCFGVGGSGRGSADGRSIHGSRGNSIDRSIHGSAGSVIGRGKNRNDDTSNDNNNNNNNNNNNDGHAPIHSSQRSGIHGSSSRYGMSGIGSGVGALAWPKDLEPSLRSVDNIIASLLSAVSSVAVDEANALSLGRSGAIGLIAPLVGAVNRSDAVRRAALISLDFLSFAEPNKPRLVANNVIASIVPLIGVPRGGSSRIVRPSSSSSGVGSGGANSGDTSRSPAGPGSAIDRDPLMRRHAVRILRNLGAHRDAHHALVTSKAVTMLADTSLSADPFLSRFSVESLAHLLLSEKARSKLADHPRRDDLISLIVRFARLPVNGVNPVVVNVSEVNDNNESNRSNGNDTYSSTGNLAMDGGGRDKSYIYYPFPRGTSVEPSVNAWVILARMAADRRLCASITRSRVIDVAVMAVFSEIGMIRECAMVTLGNWWSSAAEAGVVGKSIEASVGHIADALARVVIEVSTSGSSSRSAAAASGKKSGKRSSGKSSSSSASSSSSSSGKKKSTKKSAEYGVHPIEANAAAALRMGHIAALVKPGAVFSSSSANIFAHVIPAAFAAGIEDAAEYIESLASRSKGITTISSSAAFDATTASEREKIARIAVRSAIFLVHGALAERAIAVRELISQGLLRLAVLALRLNDPEISAAAANLLAFCLGFFQDDVVAKMRKELISLDAVRHIMDASVEEESIADRTADIIQALLNGSHLNVGVNEPGVAKPAASGSLPPIIAQCLLTEVHVPMDVEELFNPQGEI